MATEATVLTGQSANGADVAGTETSPATLTGDGLDTSVTTGTDTGADTAGSEAAQQADTEAVQAGEDGRLIPAHIKALQESNPALYKSEKARFFEHRAFKEHFATPQEAATARNLLDQIGGEEGWNEVLERQAQQDKFNTEYTSSDPEVRRAFIKGMFKDDPYSARSIVPLYLDEYRLQAPQEYTRIMSRIISNTFNSAFDNLGVKRVLAQLGQKFTAANQQVPEELQALAQWVNRFEELANSHSGMDEERERFEQERRTWQSEQQRDEAETWTRNYHASTRAEGSRLVRQHLANTLKGNFPDGASMNRLVTVIEERISEMAGKDQNFIRQRDQIIQRKDTERAKKFVLNKIKSLLVDAVNKEPLVRPWLKNRTAPRQQQTTTGQQPAPTAGIVQLARQPQPAEIYWGRGGTNSEMVMRNEAVLKDGKHVRWA